MGVVIAANFFSSLGSLQPKEQARAIDFVNRFQQNPAHPSLSLERLNTKDGSLWSGRISQDLRAILHKEGEMWSLLHAGHHDPAYRWAERRTVTKHSVTGVLQVLETIESTTEVQSALPAVGAVQDPTFGDHDDAYLLSLGVPEDWLPTLRRVSNDDQLLIVLAKLPTDVAERLMALAAGDFVTPPAPVGPDKPMTEHEDFRRRFFVADDSDELMRALEAPMEKWIAFLHPSQRKLVEADANGPVKVTGGAGTGKTVVAMHRARHLAKQHKNVLLTSYVRTLCANMERALGLFCSASEIERITVSSVHSQALAFARAIDPEAQPASEDETHALLDHAARKEAPGWGRSFVRTEWDNVVAIQGIRTWEEYRTAKRTGRGSGLSVKDRKDLWGAFEAVRRDQKRRHEYDWAAVCLMGRDALEQGKTESPFDAVVIDEAQDLKGPELRFLAALSQRENLMLVGDTGQRIYPGGFALLSLGIDVRGRSHTLRVNYRTTEQIRRAADKMLGTISDDMDGGTEDRSKVRSLLKGPEPTLRGFATECEELKAVSEQIQKWQQDGLAPRAIGVFARSRKQLEALDTVLSEAGIPVHALDSDGDVSEGVRLGTMHRAKGLEFKAVVVLGCEDKLIPSAFVLNQLDDPQDQEDAVAREHRLLYVAMTRARDELLVTWTGKPSRFLQPLGVS